MWLCLSSTSSVPLCGLHQVYPDGDVPSHLWDSLHLWEGHPDRHGHHQALSGHVSPTQHPLSPVGDLLQCLLPQWVNESYRHKEWLDVVMHLSIVFLSTMSMSLSAHLFSFSFPHPLCPSLLASVSFLPPLSFCVSAWGGGGKVRVLPKQV